MKTYFRILSYASPYSRIIPLYLILTLFYILFSMVNFSIMIPLLEVLFNQVDYDISKNIVNNREFNFSIDYLKSTFYSHFSDIIQTSGREEALKFVCLIILISVFLANIFKYLSSLIIAKVRVRVAGDDPTAAGQRGKMYNNVAINTSGIMVKGDYHFIANNTVIGSNKNGMIILDEENSNLNTFTQNNLVDKLSGHRSLSNYEDKDRDGNADYPIPGTSSNN